MRRRTARAERPLHPATTSPPPATLTFAPGETSKHVNVTVNGDTTAESNETFFVNLSAHRHAVPPDPGCPGHRQHHRAVRPARALDRDRAVVRGRGNRDARPSRSVARRTRTSASTSTPQTAPPTQPGRLHGTHVGIGSWAAGDASDKTVTVPINDDTVDENAETFTASRSPTSRPARRSRPALRP